MTYASDAAAFARFLRRDERAKGRIAAAFPSVVMDGDEFAAASSHELAVRALRSVGLQVPHGADPVECLDFYLRGRQDAPARRTRGLSGAAWDGAEVGATDFVSKHLRGGE